jgi:AraC-like DNA-binding protein
MKLHWEMKAPPETLTDFVSGYWKFHNVYDTDYNTVVVPDGRVDVIYSLGENGVQAVLRGLDTEPGPGTIPPQSEYFAINFKLPAAEYLFGRSISALANGGELLPDGWWGITQNDLTDFEGFCQKISSVLLTQVKPLDPRKRLLFENIYASNGTMTVQELSDKSGWSSRQINRYFHDWFGLSLKAYCNIVRMSASFLHISEGRLFPELDYTDQNHFIKEIKKYTGVTPKELSKNTGNRFAIISALKNLDS